MASASGSERRRFWYMASVKKGVKGAMTYTTAGTAGCGVGGWERRAGFAQQDKGRHWQPLESCMYVQGATETLTVSHSLPIPSAALRTLPAHTAHLAHGEQHLKEGGQREEGVLAPAPPLEPLAVEAHVDVGQVVNELHQVGHHGVEPAGRRARRLLTCRCSWCAEQYPKNPKHGALGREAPPDGACSPSHHIT